MIYAVLLCNKEWNIVKIKQNVSGLSLKPGDCLADVVQDADELTENDEKQYSLFLTFRENGMTLSTLVRSFQEGNLVILSHVRSDADFVEFNNEYLDFVEWVENHLEGFYHSEYFQIQKLNNQLIDSQRALIRSKRNLEMALEENKKINRKISEARQAAEQASRSKTQFLANMSHDIRTPMNGIIGMLNIADRYVDNPDEVKKYHQKIRMASEYLLALINDVLDMRKIDQKDIMLLEESVNLRDVIENCRDILEAKAARLKVLTEDIVEASKASTGNLTLEMTDINFVEMLYQVMGEFEERLADRHLTLMTHFPDTPAMISADGRRMWRILEKFVEYFDDIYGDRDEKFLEADGRRYFMLFLKPIINGTGNYYIEARTRNDEQTDMIIDYLGQQYIIEMKIWHGNAYNERGEKQLSDYLEYYHVDKGYMLSFNFNKNKKIGVKEVVLGEKLLIEAVV